MVARDVVVRWWESVIELVRSERGEVEQCQVDALTVLSSNDPRSVCTITSCRDLSDTVTGDVTFTGRAVPDGHVVRVLITTRVHVHCIRWYMCTQLPNNYLPSKLTKKYRLMMLLTVSLRSSYWVIIVISTLFILSFFIVLKMVILCSTYESVVFSSISSVFLSV